MVELNSARLDRVFRALSDATRRDMLQPPGGRRAHGERARRAVSHVARRRLEAHPHARGCRAHPPHGRRPHASLPHRARPARRHRPLAAALRKILEPPPRRPRARTRRSNPCTTTQPASRPTPCASNDCCPAPSNASGHSSPNRTSARAGWPRVTWSCSPAARSNCSFNHARSRPSPRPRNIATCPWASPARCCAASHPRLLEFSWMESHGSTFRRTCRNSPRAATRSR